MAAIRRSISFALLLAGSFGVLIPCLVSCRSGFQWEGTWSGNRALKVQPGTPDYLVNSLDRVTLKISDGTYELNASGIPRRGVFHSSGQEAFLEPVTAFDHPTNDTSLVKVAANKDGTITLASPDSLDSSPIVLHRESQPTGSNVRKR